MINVDLSQASWNSPVSIPAAAPGTLTITDSRRKGKNVVVIKSAPQKLSLKCRLNSARIWGSDESSDKVSEDAVWLTVDLIVSNLNRKPVSNESAKFRRNRNKLFLRMSIIATDVIEETLWNERDGYEYRAVTSFTAHYPVKGNPVRMFTKEDSQNFGSYIIMYASEVLPMMFNEEVQYCLSSGRGEFIYTLSEDASISYVWQPEPQVHSLSIPVESTQIDSTPSVTLTAPADLNPVVA